MALLNLDARMDEVVDAYISRQRKNDAFADVLTELFKRYPLPEYTHEHVHESHRITRKSAIRRAREGTLHKHVIFENDWRVPTDELLAAYILIYG